MGRTDIVPQYLYQSLHSHILSTHSSFSSSSTTPSSSISFQTLSAVLSHTHSTILHSPYPTHIASSLIQYTIHHHCNLPSLLLPLYTIPHLCILPCEPLSLSPLIQHHLCSLRLSSTFACHSPLTESPISHHSSHPNSIPSATPFLHSPLRHSVLILRLLCSRLYFHHKLKYTLQVMDVMCISYTLISIDVIC